jgi:hypothetical protein
MAPYTLIPRKITNTKASPESPVGGMPKALGKKAPIIRRMNIMQEIEMIARRYAFVEGINFSPSW